MRLLLIRPKTDTLLHLSVPSGCEGSKKQDALHFADELVRLGWVRLHDLHDLTGDLSRPTSPPLSEHLH